MGRRVHTLPPPSYAGTKVNIDNSHLPFARLNAKVIEEWKEDAIGDVYQIECEVINHDGKPVTDFYIEISPADCVLSIWNLARMKAGVYRLLGFWTDAGGLQAGKSMSWGMLSTTATPTMTIKPHMEPETKTDAQADAKADVAAAVKQPEP